MAREGVCFFKEKEKEHKIEWVGRRERSVRNWGREKHDHDALYKKNLKEQQKEVKSLMEKLQSGLALYIMPVKMQLGIWEN